MADIIRTAHVDKAAELFNSGYNCAQATLCAFADTLGIDEAELRRVSACFGGGISGIRQTCGAITGMLMALGLLEGGFDVKDVDSKHALYAEGQELMNAFKAEFGYTDCAELTSLVASKFKTEPHPLVACRGNCRACTAFVAYAVKTLEERL